MIPALVCVIVTGWLLMLLLSKVPHPPEAAPYRRPFPQKRPEHDDNLH